MKTVSIIVAILLAIVGFILGVTSLALRSDEYRCHNYASNTGHTVRFGFWSDTCYVKTSAGWFDYKQINQNTISK